MNNDKQQRMIREIRERYGDVIDLATSPMVLIEIIRNYRGIVAGDDDGGGGVSPGTSTVAVAGPDSPPTPPSPPESDRFQVDEILRAVLRLQRQVSTMEQKLDRMVSGGGT